MKELVGKICSVELTGGKVFPARLRAVTRDEIVVDTPDGQRFVLERASVKDVKKPPAGGLARVQ